MQPKRQKHGSETLPLVPSQALERSNASNEADKTIEDVANICQPFIRFP